MRTATVQTGERRSSRGGGYGTWLKSVQVRRVALLPGPLRHFERWPTGAYRAREPVTGWRGTSPDRLSPNRHLGPGPTGQGKTHLSPRESFGIDTLVRRPREASRGR